MIYLFETKLYDSKSIAFALSSVYGIGIKQSTKICNKLGFAKNLKVRQLSEEQIKKLTRLIEISNLVITSELKKFKNLLLKTLVSIKSYKGLRKIKGLPVRGQRTHTNSRTARKVRN